ncbi:MAG: hypothetical protein KJ592_04110 [Nanoarchaeota archaeon]|nr:hypothetical protein [Nanoarchaeota archaeon]
MAKKQNLIKKSALLNELKNNQISRVSRDAMKLLTDNISENINRTILKLKQSIQSKAKKTLEKSDVQEIYSNLNKKQDIDY